MEPHPATRVADDPSLQKQELHFFDGLGHPIDANRSDVASFALRGSSRPPEPEDLRSHIGEALRLLRERLESQSEVVKNRRGDEFRKAEVLDRLNALEQNVGPEVPFHEMVPAVMKEFIKNGGGDPKAFSVCNVFCSCC